MILGADRVMPKLFYFNSLIRDHGYQYSIYSHDQSLFARECAEKYSVKLLAGPPHRRSIIKYTRDMFRLFMHLRSTEYHHIELYSDYHILASFGYFLAAKWFRLPVVVWCRGELYMWKELQWWQKTYFRIILPRSDCVFLKEMYMRETLKREGIAPKLAIDMANTVEVPQDVSPKDTPTVIKLVFMNMFKKWRNVWFCAEIARTLKERKRKFEFSIVGHKDDSAQLLEESGKLKHLLAKYDLDNEVKVFPFTENPVQFLRDAHYFVLPAELVFCNYALIEAMSFGVIPLVLNHDSDYRKILPDDAASCGIPLVSELWVDKIIEISDSPTLFRSLSTGARDQIIERYSTLCRFRTYSAAVNLIDSPSLSLP